MKILKIELQNINSLKSETPVVIDFENEQFRDVGLFAITGSTGAGKTTILDAITIALYHNVPRFNSSKGTLLDVVSFGANDAFSRITFENDQIIYEGTWSVRLANKSGVKLKNAIEEVSLKNLSENKILASQKRRYIEEVEKVTQLDYNQFLRSVLLAQGEFASFLTAKGPEKGRLLEQITGEQIYKKIGQGILDRKSKEETKLKDIESKINAVDVLSVDKKTELLQEDTVIDEDIIGIEKKLNDHSLILDWFAKYHDLHKQTIHLEELSKGIDLKFEAYKREFDSLDQHEKAEPFKQITYELTRIEKEVLEKSKEFSGIEILLSKLKPEIDAQIKLSTKEELLLENAEKELSSWLPKFELLTTLDNQIKFEYETQENLGKESKAVIKLVDEASKEKEDLFAQFTTTSADIVRGETYIDSHKFLEEVDGVLTNWTTQLITLKGNRERLLEETEFINEKGKSIEKTGVTLSEHTKLHKTQNADLEKLEQELLVVSKSLSSHDMSTLLVSQKGISEKEMNWKQLKNLSEQTIQAKKEQAFITKEQKSLKEELTNVMSQLESLNKQYIIQEKLVAKANEVLNLEKKISKYEEERLRLKEGEPCGLCGALSHPFVKEGVVCSVSDAEVAMRKANEDLNQISTSEKELDKDQVAINTKLSVSADRLMVVLDSINSNQLAAVALGINCELSNYAKIEETIEILFKELVLVGGKIENANKLQTKSNLLSNEIGRRKDNMNRLISLISELGLNIKNEQKEIQEKSNSVNSLSKLIIKIENTLNDQFSKYGYKVPSNAQMTSFIDDLKHSLGIYKKSQESLARIKSKLELIKANIENNEKQRTIHSERFELLKEQLNVCSLKLEKLSKDREVLLPKSISVDAKRSDLVGNKNLLVKQLDDTKKQLQKLLDIELKNKTLKVDSKDQIVILQGEFDAKRLLFDKELVGSGFTSRESVENALLSNEVKEKYTLLKEKLKNEKIKNESLIETNSNDIKALAKSKNHTCSEEESKVVLLELTKFKNSFLAKKGEIKEAFRKDKEIRDRNQVVYKKIEAQESICSVWRSLFKIIGNSKDAFNVYVQRLTLKHLLDLANVHLFKLNKRYSLKIEDNYKPKEELNFSLIDHYQTDQARLVDTSSGGEKFIISLALALGLSDLASKSVKIDSLFIDEGFGTLDGNTLETVISTLETLQSQGKMIGVISHVENLKERISTQIKITKQSSGVSTVSVS